MLLECVNAVYCIQIHQAMGMYLYMYIKIFWLPSSALTHKE